jgi:hypothetical protein
MAPAITFFTFMLLLLLRDAGVESSARSDAGTITIYLRSRRDLHIGGRTVSGTRETVTLAQC